MSGAVKIPLDADAPGRTCRGCDEFLEWSRFPAKAAGFNGRDSRCTPCRTAQKYLWIKNNPDLHAAHQEAFKTSGRAAAAHRRWYQRNRDLKRHRQAVRTGRTDQGSYSFSDWQRLLARHGGLCAYCREAQAVEREHVVPISRGGSNFVGNVLPVCVACNRSKGALTFMEWRLSGRAPDAAKPITRRKDK